MANIESLRDLGYDVNVAFGEGDPDVPTVYSVSGYGILTYVHDDDSETIDAFLDKEAHAERVRLHEAEPPEPVDRVADLRKQVDAAESVDEVKAALSAVLDFISPPAA